MPLYEYYCRRCQARFELLRPLSRMDEPATCPEGHANGRRVLSMFAAQSRGSDGEISSVGSGCAGCAGGTCSSCSVN